MEIEVTRNESENDVVVVIIFKSDDVTLKFRFSKRADKYDDLNELIRQLESVVTTDESDILVNTNNVSIVLNSVVAEELLEKLLKATNKI